MTRPNGHKLREEVFGEHTVFDTGLIRLIEYNAQRADGSVSRHQAAVIKPTSIAVILRHDHVLMQYRHRHHQENLGFEFLGGSIETDEAPIEAAIREAEEEGNMRPLGDHVELPSFEAYPGLVRSRIYSFIWNHAVETDHGQTRTENSELAWVSSKELTEMIAEGELIGGPTIAVAYMTLPHMKPGAHRAVPPQRLQ